MNRWFEATIRAAIIAVVLVIVGWLLGIVFPIEQVPEKPVGFVGSVLLPWLSAFLMAAALAYPISRSRLRGRRSFAAVFLAVFGLMTVLTLVEAAVFLQMTAGELLTELFKTTVNALALSGLAVVLFPHWESEITMTEHAANPPTSGSWIRRWIGVSFVYLVLYVVAGMLILPLVRTFYEAQGTLQPNPVLFLPFQLARGALFVAVVLPLLRSLEVSRWRASLAMAVMIPLVHGVAGLIPPNPFMPDFVRHAHMIEIGWSTFVFGLLIGFLFWKPPLVAAEPEQVVREAA